MTIAFTKVAVLCATDLEYPREVIAGVRRFATPDKRWVFALMGSSPSSIEPLREFAPDGVIAQIGGTHVRDGLVALGVPTVNVSGRRDDVPFPRVGIDDEGVGRMAADYFLARGYRQFAFDGFATPLYEAYAARRRSGYAERLALAGVRLYADARSRNVVPWLLGLPKPVAIFSASDTRGAGLCNSCRELGIRVPEDIAILGVDNDALMCDIAYPPLSSIAIAADRVGYEAAALLDRLMHGETPPDAPITVPPIGVITRQSSDALAVHDPSVLAAMQYIRQNVDRGINVDDVARELAVSRRWLEHVFHRALQRTPGEEIRRVRILRAQELLAGTDLSMPEIARRVGFSDARRLSVTLRHVLNTTPTAYRRQSRAEGASAKTPENS